MQKLLLILMLTICMADGAYAAAPSTSCPTGYVTIKETAMTLADSTCPSGYTSAGAATSCLVTSPAGSCMMYVPTDMSFTDDYGTYKYTTICPLDD